MSAYSIRCHAAAGVAVLAIVAATPSFAAGDGLPPGTEACDLSAWSIDTDPSGLNVRAEPSTRSRVLGTLPPPFRYRSDADGPEGGYRTEFRIIGFRDGWFLIERAEPPGRKYDGEGRYPARHPRPYLGRGWVSAAKVGAAYANGETRMGGLFAGPSEESAWSPAMNGSGQPIESDGTGPKRVLTCKGPWVLLESHDGVTGWWRTLCSNQVTSCS